MLAECKGLDDIRAVRDMAEAARLYARAAGLGQEAMNEAAENKLRAERKDGEVLAEMDKNRGGWNARESCDTDAVSQASPPPRLADLGITPNQSMHWQTEATVPEPEFERWVDERKDDGEPLSTAGLVRRARELVEEQDTADHRHVLAVVESTDHDASSCIARPPPAPGAGGSR